jgi:hypothetical protein
MALDEIIDGLYALPPDEFVEARNRAAADLRKDGRREDADLVKALRKPSAAAGAVNALVREHRGEVDAYLEAAAALRDAQFAGKGDFATAAKRERETLAKLIRIGGEPVRQSMLAAAVDEDAAAHVLEARLERELEPRGFEALLAHVSPGAKTAPRAKPKPDDREARAKLQEAKNELKAAEAEERQAHRRWDQAQRQVEEARAAVEAAQRRLDRIRGD